MRIAVAVAVAVASVLTLLLGACSGEEEKTAAPERPTNTEAMRSAGATSCPMLIEWDDVLYVAGNVDRHVTFDGRLAAAIVPPCGDRTGVASGSDDGERVRAFRIPGVDPHVAIGVPYPSGRRVYLAAGFLPELPGHPLHDAAYGSARRPNERAGWRCGDPIRDVVGTVTTSGWSLRVRFKGERVRRQYNRTALFVDAATTIRGFDEYGLPRILEGDRIRATVRECTSGSRYKVVADTISDARG